MQERTRTYPRACEDGRTRTHVHDTASVGDKQVGKGLHHADRSPDIRLVKLLRLLNVYVQYGRGIPGAGIVDQHDESTAAVRHSLDCLGHR